MKQKWLSVVLTGLFLIALTGSAFAWSGKADVSGKPSEINQKNSQPGYYIWQDGQEFHIWTATNNRKHVFNGVIRTDGNFNRVQGNRLERGDSFKFYDDDKQPARSWFKAFEGERGRHFAFDRREVDTDQDSIRFKFDNTGGADGLTFRVSNATYVDFDLYVDGRPVPRKQIYIGEDGWHPTSAHFKLVK